MSFQPFEMELADIDAAELQDTLLEYRPSKGSDALRRCAAVIDPLHNSA